MSTPALADSNLFAIPSGPLDAALRIFAAQSHAQILFDSALVRGKSSAEITGRLDFETALERLLFGQGLDFHRTPRGAIVITRPGSVRDGAFGTETSSIGASEHVDIVVTATKRPEQARRIAGSVSVKTRTQLRREGAQSYADVLTRTPGVVFNATAPGLSTASIRGVSSTTLIDQGQGTTGYFINDVPLTDPYFAVGIPDIDTFDVDNVTVLKGPQGTLFGSASLGGAINYQAAKPDLTGFHAHVQGTVEGTRRGAVGGSGKIMLNVPVVTDTLAVRGVFYDRRDAGYIDNLGTGRKNANLTETRGGRVLATWAIDDATTLNYLFLDQTQKTRDLGDSQPLTAGAYAKRTAFPEFANFSTVIHNLRLDRDLGFATLTATATYHSKRQSTKADDTAFFGALLGGLTSPVAAPQHAYAKGQTYEIRLASPTGSRFEYLIGGYFDRTKENFFDDFTAPNATAVIETLYSGLFGAGIGQKATGGTDSIYVASLPFVGKEGAVFGELSYHLSDTLKITAGGRGFWTSARNVSTSSGLLQLLTAGTVTTTLTGTQKESGFNPKGSITWTPNTNLMVYGLVSKGFRFGGPNINASTPGAPIPPTFKSDSLINYEFGVRSDLLDHRLTLDGTLYYVDWSDIQLRLGTAAGLAYAANAGKARNYGFEAAATLRPVTGLTLQGNVTYLNATLRAPFDPGAGQAVIPKGTVLPGASKWQVSDSIGYQWANTPLHPNVIVLHRYVSSADSNLTFAGKQGGYNVLDARAGINFDRFALTAFIENIADKRGVTNTQNFAPLPFAQYLIRPRTIGLTFDAKI